MVQWGDGYLTDIAYTNGFFREITPHWLAMVALLRGQRPPDLSRPFRYADLGCGNGFTATVVAATMPQAEVWGFDFNPAHIETASRMAAAAGLPNVQFREASFAELVALPHGALPDFDFIVCHGVLTHVSPENRRLLVELIGRRLKPGGLAYLGYNVAVGWAGMAPMRQLAGILAGAPGDRGLADMPEWIDRLRGAGGRYLAEHPAIAARVADWRREDPRYFAHEYLGDSWHPLMFSEVADALAAVGCQFTGSATLVENVDSLSVPPDCVSLLAGVRDVSLQEMLRDFARAQTFRRDVYRRGAAQMSAAEQAGRLDLLRFCSLEWPAHRPVTVNTPLGVLTAGEEFYRPALSALASGQASFQQIRGAAAEHGQSAENALLATLLLVGGGAITPMALSAPSRLALNQAVQLNQVLIDGAASGAELTQLVAPVVGAALGSDLREMLIVRLLLQEGGPGGDLGKALSQALAACRSHRDSAAGSAEVPPNLGNLVDYALRERVPVLRRLGVLPTGP